jgi:hypothetical protein
MTGYVQLERVNLALPVGAGLHRPGSADQVAGPWERMGPQPLAHVNRSQLRQGDALGVDDDEVDVTVAIWVNPLNVGNPSFGAATAGQLGWTVRRRDLLRRRPRPAVGRWGFDHLGLGARVGCLADTTTADDRQKHRRDHPANKQSTATTL